MRESKITHGIKRPRPVVTDTHSTPREPYDVHDQYLHLLVVITFTFALFKTQNYVTLRRNNHAHSIQFTMF